ncbi:hypothetical protein, partial [Trinickia dabaoshanensis]|uniref:hypothetical protein n=1 Tax=Trinickia dabaoshanensis TaxID=564714 RepID=UPI001E4241BE
YSSRCSRTMRTARSRTSAENLFGLFIAPFSQELEPPQNPGRFRLPGLIHYYAACSPAGQMIHVSIWDTDEHAKQMNGLKEMIVDAKSDAEKVGVKFTPIVHYPTNWEILAR